MCDKTHLEVEADKAKAVFEAVDNLAKILALACAGFAYLAFHSWLWGGVAGAMAWFLTRNPYAKYHRQMQTRLQNRQHQAELH